MQRREALKKPVKVLLSREGHYKNALLCQKSLQLEVLDPELGLLQAHPWQGMLWTPYHLNSVLISLSSLAVWLLNTWFCVCTSCIVTKVKKKILSKNVVQMGGSSLNLVLIPFRRELSRWTRTPTLSSR